MASIPKNEEKYLGKSWKLVRVISCLHVCRVLQPNTEIKSEIFQAQAGSYRTQIFKITGTKFPC